MFLAFAMTMNLFWWIGDVNSISVGSGTNIQDNSLVHVAKSNLSGKVLPTIIGDNVTVGEHNGSCVWFLPIRWSYVRCFQNLFYPLKFELGRSQCCFAWMYCWGWGFCWHGSNTSWWCCCWETCYGCCWSSCETEYKDPYWRGMSANSLSLSLSKNLKVLFFSEFINF